MKLSLLAFMLWPTLLSGQWVVSAEVGADRYWGGSVEKTAQHRSFRPYRPTSFGVGLERRSARLSAALHLRYASASLGLEGAGGVVAAKGALSAYTAAPEIIYRLAYLGAVNRLLVRTGPLFEVWRMPDGGSESRVGVQAAVSLGVPLGRRLEGSLVAGGAVIGSPFAAGQLDSDFERRALWRRRFAVGLNYRL